LKSKFNDLAINLPGCAGLANTGHVLLPGGNLPQYFRSYFNAHTPAMASSVSGVGYCAGIGLLA